MDIQDLDKDRFLQKNPQQTDSTKSAVYTSVNPTPKKGVSQTRKWGQANDSQEDGGAPNIITGTVIVSCFIQTSALPSRIEMQGNDLTFFDDTYTQNGIVIGDTSRLIFTHGSAKKGEVISAGFIMEKRASVFNTYDNVLSWFSPVPPSGSHNYMFIGRNGLGTDQERNISSIHFGVNATTDFQPIPGNPPLNGVWEVEYAEDGVGKQRLLYTGRSDTLLPGFGLTGYSSFVIGGEGGLAGFGYSEGGLGLGIVFYVDQIDRIRMGADLIPDAAGAYDIGSPSFKIGTLYGSVVACPLPTVPNALEILDRIPAPGTVDGRGHYGDGLYFDDLTFPPELLYTDSKGRVEIEHNHVLGFLLKAVIELKAEVDLLKGKN